MCMLQKQSLDLAHDFCSIVPFLHYLRTDFEDMTVNQKRAFVKHLCRLELFVSISDRL